MPLEPDVIGHLLDLKKCILTRRKKQGNCKTVLTPATSLIAAVDATVVVGPTPSSVGQTSTSHSTKT